MDVDRTAEILKQAEQAVDRSGVKPELRSAALQKAVDLLAGSPSIPDDEKVDNGQPQSGLNGTGGELPDLGSLAAKLKISVDDIEEAYAVEDGALQVILPSSKIETSKKAGAQQLAILVCAGRQATGLDAEWTPSEEIREVCRDFSRFDQANFAASLRSLDDDFRFSGSGQRTKVKLTRQGWETAAKLLSELVQGSG